MEQGEAMIRNGTAGKAKTGEGIAKRREGKAKKRRATKRQSKDRQ